MSFFSERLKWLRERNGFTQIEMSEKLGMSRSNYSKYEYAQREPTLDTLAKFPGILGESLDFLLGVTDFHTGIEKQFRDLNNSIRLFDSIGDLIESATLDPDSIDFSLFPEVSTPEEFIAMQRKRASSIMQSIADKANFLLDKMSEIPLATFEKTEFLKKWARTQEDDEV